MSDILSLGMIFSSEEECCQIVERYAERVGFTLRKSFRTKGSIGRMLCSRAGHPEVKITQPEKQRNRSSLRCGCEFEVCFRRKDSGEERASIWELESAKLEHTGGCVPSAQQRSVGLRRAGTKVSLMVLTTLKELIEVGGQAKHIRLVAL